DNLKYFGEPVYEYTLGQGIEDGYLAACEIREGRVNLDDTGITIDDIMARQPHSPRKRPNSTDAPLMPSSLQKMSAQGSQPPGAVYASGYSRHNTKCVVNSLDLRICAACPE